MEENMDTFEPIYYPSVNNGESVLDKEHNLPAMKKIAGKVETSSFSTIFEANGAKGMGVDGKINQKSVSLAGSGILEQTQQHQQNAVDLFGKGIGIGAHSIEKSYSFTSCLIQIYFKEDECQVERSLPYLRKVSDEECELENERYVTKSATYSDGAQKEYLDISNYTPTNIANPFSHIYESMEIDKDLADKTEPIVTVPSSFCMVPSRKNRNGITKESKQSNMKKPNQEAVTQQQVEVTLTNSSSKKSAIVKECVVLIERIHVPVFAFVRDGHVQQEVPDEHVHQQLPEEMGMEKKSSFWNMHDLTVGMRSRRLVYNVPPPHVVSFKEMIIDHCETRRLGFSATVKQAWRRICNRNRGNTMMKLESHLMQYLGLALQLKALPKMKIWVDARSRWNNNPNADNETKKVLGIVCLSFQLLRNRATHLFGQLTEKELSERGGMPTLDVPQDQLFETNADNIWVYVDDAIEGISQPAYDVSTLVDVVRNI